MEALRIILTKVQEGKLDIDEALVLIEAIGVNKVNKENKENKENKSLDLIFDPQETPVTPVTIPWVPNPTSPYIRERTAPMPGWNEVTCGKSGDIEINESNTSISN